jgi:hypothetical protein
MAKKKREFQDIRIREVPTDLARRFRSALVADGYTLNEWFILEAAKTARIHEDRVKEGRGGRG